MRGVRLPATYISPLSPLPPLPGDVRFAPLCSDGGECDEEGPEESPRDTDGHHSDGTDAALEPCTCGDTEERRKVEGREKEGRRKGEGREKEGMRSRGGEGDEWVEWSEWG